MPALITWWTQDITALHPGAAAGAVQAAGSDLLARWTEPHRRYHGTQHLVEIFWALEQLEEAGHLDAHFATVARVAGWLHDAVYDPTARPGVNELDSAALARSVLAELGLGAAEIDTVERLIRLTAGHEVEVSSPSRAFAVESAFLDADLWILGAEAARYDDYCTQVRAEYAHVPEAAYRFGRAAVLRGFSRRSRIYRTEHATRAWEPRARANLERELVRLGTPGGPVPQPSLPCREVR